MSNDNPIFVGQSLNIDFTVLNQDKDPVDISTAALSFILRAKGGVRKVVVPSVIDGPAGLLRYVTQLADLDTPGEFEAQCVVTLDSAVYPSSVVSFEVLANI